MGVYLENHRFSRSPWDDYMRLGELVQGKQRHVVGIPRIGDQTLHMFKKVLAANRKRVDLLAIEHPNIATIRQIFAEEHAIYLHMEYTRHTLEEMIYVHLPLKEAHIRIIAQSIFAAISHLGLQGFVHGKLSLADWEVYSVVDPNMLPNDDFEGLGLVLIDCMDGALRSQDNTVAKVKQQRAAKKVYGLNTAEKWSGSKQLIDLLEDMFSESRTARVKIDKPHTYLLEPCSDVTIFVPCLELVSLECHTLWYADTTDL
ncbi:hypothetical protein BDV97DRAFT_415663 [Delphinella strobiligena]|nr:hypothetical protein BDV97DRAFT_415663 [Delphinella strobiligena]